MCKPCTPKCKCKINCKNPHNNGGKCDKCRVVNADVSTITNSEPQNIDNGDSSENTNYDGNSENTQSGDNNENTNDDEGSDSSYDDDGDSEHEEESNDTNEQDDTLLPTQLATSNDSRYRFRDRLGQ